MEAKANPGRGGTIREGQIRSSGGGAARSGGGQDVELTGFKRTGPIRPAQIKPKSNGREELGSSPLSTAAAAATEQPAATATAATAVRDGAVASLCGHIVEHVECDGGCMDSVPDGIVQHILSMLSNVRDLAACTCVCRRWRDCVPYLPALFFPRNAFDAAAAAGGAADEAIGRMVATVARLRALVIYCPFSMVRMDAAADKAAEGSHLDCIVLATGLEELRLWGLSLTAAPACGRLERLRVLEIVGAPMRDNAVKDVVAACPNLTDLSLLGCDSDSGDGGEGWSGGVPRQWPPATIGLGSGPRRSGDGGVESGDPSDWSASAKPGDERRWQPSCGRQQMIGRWLRRRRASGDEAWTARVAAEPGVERRRQPRVQLGRSRRRIGRGGWPPQRRSWRP